jgi:hypothetical protein
MNDAQVKELRPLPDWTTLPIFYTVVGIALVITPFYGTWKKLTGQDS